MKVMQLALLLALALTACGGQATAEPTATPAPTATPLELFEAAIPGVSEITFTAAREEYKLHCLKIVVAEISYDVEATNSLVSPFVGTVAYLVVEAASGGTPSQSIEITESYAFQDGVWVLKDTEVDNPVQYVGSLLGAGYCAMTKP